MPGLSVRRQCELLGLNRSSWYYRPTGESAENLQWMRRIDEQYLKTPCFGSRKMGKKLGISRSKAQRLMRLMGLEAIYPKPHLSRNETEHRIYRFQVLIKLSWAGLLPQGSYNRFQGRFVCIIFLFPRFLA